MAAKLRHWKEKDGRYWARIAIPVELKPLFNNRTQLTEPLGGDRRLAERNHPAAVARLLAQIESARQRHAATTFAQNETASSEASDIALRAITDDDTQRAVWDHYQHTLASDTEKRASMPTPAEIEAEFERTMQRIEAGESDPAKFGTYAPFNVQADYELLAGARHHDERNRARRLAALRTMLISGETRLVDPAVKSFVEQHNLNVSPGSRDRHELALKIMRAEIEGLERTLELDQGIFDGQPKDPIIRQPTTRIKKPTPVSFRGLFADYVKAKQVEGTHLDGGANWEHPVQSLIRYFGHDDALRMTSEELIAWRNSLRDAGLSTKMIGDKYLAAIRAVMTWAFDEHRLPANPMASVRQKIAKSVRLRERGYTTTEAKRILDAALSYRPAEVSNPSNRESPHITSAKRWLPLLCAFSGARPAEIAQLRKKDIREEDRRWILRITPEAGSVKTGEFRDVPLHRQVIELGFIDFVKGAADGALFHRATDPKKFLSSAQNTAGRVATWLNASGLVPENVQPHYGWRHRFKTQGRELGVSDRVLDAIQGHPGKKAADDYGDVTIAAKLRLIDALPDYELDILRNARTKA